MSKHTPEPWTVVADGPWVCDKGGFTVAIVATSGMSSETLKANARLIAAAPELLAAAKGALAVASSLDGADDDWVAVTALRVAIAKAEGEN